MVSAAAIAAVTFLARAGWPATTHEVPTVEHVLIISVPTLTWADVDPAITPNLARLADESLVANLSPAAAEVPASPGDGYVTLGAGARASGAPGSDGLARRGPGGTVRHTGVEAIRRRNMGLPFGAEVAALGTALSAADRTTAVIANADTVSPGSGRQAVAALMGADGVVPGGSVSGGLLAAEPSAPFGRRLDNDAVVHAWRRSSEASVVLIEASDLARSDASVVKADSATARSARVTALRSTDDLVGRLLDEVDADHVAVLLVGPYPPAGSAALTVAAMRAPTSSPGLMRSSVTRRGGSVTLVDVAPTVLALLSIERPTSMEGRPFEPDRRGGQGGERRSRLVTEAGEARQVARLGVLVPRLLVGAVVLLAAAALVSTIRGGAGTRRWLQVASLAVLAIGPVTYLTRLAPTLGAGWTLLLIGGAATTVGGLFGRLRKRGILVPLAGVLAMVTLTVAIDVLAGNPLQFNSALGFSPIVAARFRGLGNLAFAQLAGASIMLAGLAASPSAGRTGRQRALAILVTTVVIVGVPWWGADVGGTLSLVPAAGVTMLGLSGRWPRPRRVVLLAILGVSAVLAMTAIDLASPAGLQTHLARLAVTSERGGVQSLVAVIDRKLHASLSTFGKEPWTLLLPAVALLAAVLLWLYPDRLRALEARVPQLRAVGCGLVTLAVLGSFLNDSGLQVAAMTIAVALSAFVYLLVAGQDDASPGDGLTGRPGATSSTSGPSPPPCGTTDASAGVEPASRRQVVGALVALAGASLALRLPSLLAGRHLSYHEGVFALSAVAMRHGATPFRDLPSPQGPLFLALVWLGDLGGLRSMDAPRLVAVVSGMVATACAFLVGRKISTPTGGVLTAILVGASGSFLWVSGPLASDGTAIALALAALVVVTHSDSHRLDRAAPIVAGVLLACAVAVKALIAPAVVPVVGVIALRRDRRALAAFAAALVGTSSVLWLPFGLARSWDQSVTYHMDSPRLLPVGTVVGDALQLLRDRDPMLLACLAAAVGATTIVIARAAGARRSAATVLAEWRVESPRDAMAALLATWAALELILLLAEPAFYTHHTAMLVAPLALLAVVIAPRSALLAIALLSLSFFPWQFDGSVRPLLTPGRYQGPEAAALHDLEALEPGARVITDEPGLVWRAGLSTLPAAVDIADKAIDQGRITTAMVLGWTRETDVCAVLVWDRSLATQLPGLSAALTREGFVIAGHYGLVDQGDVDDAPTQLRTLWVKAAC